MLELQAHPSSGPSAFRVFASFEVKKQSVIVDFDVHADSLNISNEFNKENWDNPGLWDFDVVEVFIQKKSSANHYLELQVSPADQKFALLVKTPREDYEKVIKLASKAVATRTDSGFKASFNIELKDIPGEGEEIFANFHACLGKKDSRSYFSYKLNEGKQADFHRPEFFERIGSINE